MLCMSGSGGDVGYDYQADGTAFVAAHRISGQPLGWFDNFNDVPSEWSAETGWQRSSLSDPSRLSATRATYWASAMLSRVVRILHDYHNSAT
jgi:hypothetical protein